MRLGHMMPQRCSAVSIFQPNPRHHQGPGLSFTFNSLCFTSIINYHSSLFIFFCSKWEDGRKRIAATLALGALDKLRSEQLQATWAEMLRYTKTLFRTV